MWPVGGCWAWFGVVWFAGLFLRGPRRDAWPGTAGRCLWARPPLGPVPWFGGVQCPRGGPLPERCARFCGMGWYGPSGVARSPPLGVRLSPCVRVVPRPWCCGPFSFPPLVLVPLCPCGPPFSAGWTGSSPGGQGAVVLLCGGAVPWVPLCVGVPPSPRAGAGGCWACQSAAPVLSGLGCDGPLWRACPLGVVGLWGLCPGVVMSHGGLAVSPAWQAGPC